MNVHMRRAGITILGLVLLLGISALAVERGWVLLNHPSPAAFPVRGLDVSHHQGAIDWVRVGQDGRYRFVWIKATEGGDWTDPRFEENWEGATQAGLYVGAYHYFTLCRPGVDQAEHFLTVLAQRGEGQRRLPPAIDLEFDGNCRQGRPDEASIAREILAFLARMQEAGVPPVIYTTRAFHRHHLQGLLGSQPVWMRDVFRRPPAAVDGRPWVFWQYASRGWVPGISSVVDLNVFNGTEADFQQFLGPATK